MAKGQSNGKAAEGDVHSPARNTEAKATSKFRFLTILYRNIKNTQK